MTFFHHSVGKRSCSEGHLISQVLRKEKDMKYSIEKIIDKFYTATAQPQIVLTPTRESTTVYNSKLGGVPYFPQGFEYPVDLRDKYRGRPLQFLAQLNFEELPHLSGFPSSGILQFYISGDDGIWGMNYRAPSQQEGFRVIYHRRPLAKVQEPPAINAVLPFQGEFFLSGKTAKCPMTTSDYRFERAFLPLYGQYTGFRCNNWYDLKDQDYMAVCERLSNADHCAGGYPYFTQTDPRGIRQEYRDNTFLLFQVVSDGEGADKIMWGDCGVANFFIHPADLARRNFTNVLYTWDCD